MKQTINRSIFSKSSGLNGSGSLEKMLQIRSANIEDLANLRKWKNAHREYFFFKGEISEDKQAEWFIAYKNRPEDYMFIVLVNQIPIGCMGIRLVGEVWDVYNVILGLEEYGGKGYMSCAFHEMLNFANGCLQIPITLQVLKNNPAIMWYRKNGFNITSEESEYFCMLFQSVNFKKDAL